MIKVHSSLTETGERNRDDIYFTTGEGLIVASQPKWGKRRKLLGRAFHRKSVDMFVEKIGSCCETFVGRLLESEGEVVNAAHYCEILTLDILLK